MIKNKLHMSESQKLFTFHVLNAMKNKNNELVHNRKFLLRPWNINTKPITPFELTDEFKENSCFNLIPEESISICAEDYDLSP